MIWGEVEIYVSIFLSWEQIAAAVHCGGEQLDLAVGTMNYALYIHPSLLLFCLHLLLGHTIIFSSVTLPYLFPHE